MDIDEQLREIFDYYSKFGRTSASDSLGAPDRPRLAVPKRCGWLADGTARRQTTPTLPSSAASVHTCWRGS